MGRLMNGREQIQLPGHEKFGMHIARTTSTAHRVGGDGAKEGQ